MKAIFIDSKKQQVSEVEIPETGTLQAWYKIIGCDMVEIAAYLNPEQDSILVDEEGLMKLNDHSPFFIYEGAHQPFAGNGLVVGVNDEGESVSCKISIDEVKGKVKFTTKDQVLKYVNF